MKNILDDDQKIYLNADRSGKIQPGLLWSSQISWHSLLLAKVSNSHSPAHSCFKYPDCLRTFYMILEEEATHYDEPSHGLSGQ